MGSIVQWNSQKVVSERSWIQLRAVLVFFLVFIKKSKQKRNKFYYLFLLSSIVVLGPLSYL